MRMTSTVLTLCGAILFSTNSLFAQFGGGGFTDFVPAEQPAGLGMPVSTMGMMIVIAESGDRAGALSVERGEWKGVKLDSPLKSPGSYIVGQGVAVIHTQKSLYAFGGKQGQWRRLELPEDAQGQPSVSHNLAQYRNGDMLYTFCSDSTFWSGINMKTGEIWKDPSMRELEMRSEDVEAVEDVAE
ncbi:hypothetical protein [Rubinisphaera margarita]|uniref:hypothetical protein n=1 Tax=Rubinisphaera margarita TaxID=2909586 RepID=UPI001EE7A600|nr:hypothetical protein [Rubinisphaera margarita]MCG6158371.1 hypothetical protein [Rubinisphaera margarita]